MSEHEMLKNICDKIGYKLTTEYDELGEFIITKENYDIGSSGEALVELDIREIIFQPKFINKLTNYLVFVKEMDQKNVVPTIKDILNHLDDPVTFIKNII